jgi:signal transduction histidine kinase
MHFGVIGLLLVVALLSFAAFQGVWKFRTLTKNIRAKSVELPLAADLNLKISQLRSVLWEDDQFCSTSIAYQAGEKTPTVPVEFTDKCTAVEAALDNYYQQLVQTGPEIPNTSGSEAGGSKELLFVANFRKRLEKIKRDHHEGDEILHGGHHGLISSLKEDLEKLQTSAAELPLFTQQRMIAFAEQARREYHTANWLCVVFTITTIGVITILMARFRRRIFNPLETLLEGSRQVAAGNYSHRIRLDTDDEVSELADALNDMTQNFQMIQKDLNRKVRQRTREVIRSEKMASVGFLAAGIAHEINNPLASIAWSAEALEMRVHEIFPSQEESGEDSGSTADLQQMKKYLSMIQVEAFRCKEITASLLDFSRMGDPKKGPTNIADVVGTVVEMLKPLSKYREKNIHFHADYSVNVTANAQELKQVALNLITNALDSVDEGGTVEIDLVTEHGHAVLRVTDDGCGMTEEIREHLFEPFFTRRRDGQGTGLGLSITYQIIQEHGGDIEPSSAGPGKGSTFVVRLPLLQQNEQTHEKKSAA